MVHKNCKTLVFSASAAWKTVCGWHYYLANYQFAEGDPTMVTCAKCAGSAHGKEVEKADYGHDFWKVLHWMPERLQPG